MKISAHTLVMNEERFVWYAVKSVIDHVDKMLLWDMGSHDHTAEIVTQLHKEYPHKVSTNFLHSTDIYEFTKIRQHMLDEDSDSDWTILVDGDEIWWGEAIDEVTTLINKSGRKLDTIVSSYYNCIGDIFHYQGEKYGKYAIDDTQGHITIRAMNRKIPGLSYKKPHGQQGIFDSDNQLIQDRNASRRVFLTDKKSYLHMTHLRRSLQHDSDVPKRLAKYKFMKGNEFPLDFYFPESLFFSKPDNVKSVWETRSKKYENKARIYDLLRRIKNTLPLPEKSGY